MSSSAIPRGQVDLVDFVDWSGVECLNQTGNHPIANTLKQGYRDDDGLHLESDADEQLLIYIPFTQVVKLHSAVITGPEEEGAVFSLLQSSTVKPACSFNYPLQVTLCKSATVGSMFHNVNAREVDYGFRCPRTVKLFANKEHMGFSNVNDYPPSDSLSLSPEDLKGKPVTLKYVKFQNVRSLTIFIEDNHGGGDISKVQKILLYGTTSTYVQFCGCNKCSKLIRNSRWDIALACESTIEPCIYRSPITIVTQIGGVEHYVFKAHCDAAEDFKALALRCAN
ncbi:hypothetical protein ZIOFF_004630 [Zingiber officinale]|uniref:PITH domain-containing protein n=1 Tax=Zingiber officinale TaxID=94328 RepID=A0A8J5IB42_ZINOF|nr:hypothetical protein ZIOFF_004630 [Zingiber officinale]